MTQTVPFTKAVTSRGSGSKGLPQSEWTSDGLYPVIGQGSEFVEGRTDREDLVLRPEPALVLYGGHTRRAKLVTAPFVPGPNVKILTPNSDLDAAYLYRFLEQLVIESRGYADHFPEVKRSVIPLPPLTEQKRIAAILDAADALRAKRRESLEQLDTLLQSTFLEMFGDPNHPNPVGSHETQLVDMGSLTNIQTGKLDANAADLNGRFPFFTCASETLRINTAAYDAKAVLVAGNGDLNVKYYEGQFNAYQRTYIIESKDEQSLVPRFLHAFLEIYVTELRKQAIGGVIKYIKLPYLKDAMIPLPRPSVQNRFASIVESVEQQKAAHRNHLEELDTLFAALQQRAFQGEL